MKLYRCAPTALAFEITWNLIWKSGSTYNHQFGPHAMSIKAPVVFGSNPHEDIAEIRRADNNHNRSGFLWDRCNEGLVKLGFCSLH